jgi:hypothetical protein
VARERITVLSGDGADPAPDLAVAMPEPPGTWLLEGTAVGDELRGAVTFESSTLPETVLRPATRAELKRAVGELGARVRPEDTILLFVTDHGTDKRNDPLGNRITLWGRRESISVRELRGLLRRVPAQVRIVALMSQCYSGGFAALQDLRARAGLPSGAVCGYFSSTADRRAYGCYPDVRGREEIGHAFAFGTALAAHGRFARAHAEVLLSDQTPDVPLRTSDVFLADTIARAARRQRKHEARLADEILARAWQVGFQAERELAVRLAAGFGLERPSALTLADLGRQMDELEDFADEVTANARTWAAALGELNQAHLDLFVAARPAWSRRLALPTLRRLDEPARHALATELLAQLAAWVERDALRRARIARLIEAVSTLDELAYRAEVRLAALVRLRVLFARVAGRLHVQARPSSPEAATLAALERCEDLALPAGGKTNAPSRSALPRVEADQLQASLLRPAWLGFTFEPLPARRRGRLGLPEGAARVTSVAARSPAARAGLRRGDILVAAAGVLLGAGQLRAAAVLAPIDKPWPLEVLRGATRLTIGPVPEPWPALATE